VNFTAFDSRFVQNLFQADGIGHDDSVGWLALGDQAQLLGVRHGPNDVDTPTEHLLQFDALKAELHAASFHLG
jgi:hypothetical protein